MSDIDQSTLVMSSTAVILNQRNANSGILHKERRLLNNPSLWHKILVKNKKGVSRDYILKTLLDVVHPLDFIPVRCAEDKEYVSFFARNCKMAIEKLCKLNLVVADPADKSNPFKLTIILSYTNTTDLSVNVQDNIVLVLSKRYNNKTLNLDCFYKDPDLQEFCALSQPKIMYFVIHICRQFQIQHLKLTNNDISILSPIESICGMKTLHVLDLRNNNISDISELNILKTMQITELYLDGNPLCDKYDEYSYVKAVKEVCPKLEKLDGVLLSQNGFLAFRRNYLCNMNGQELVDQFLQHYFSLYDAENRSILEEVYHKHAMFSLTNFYLPGQSTTATASLGRYKHVSRNIKVLSDLARSDEGLMIGSQKIIKVLSNLPASDHDPYTFTVDLIYYTKTTAIVTVTGVFREGSQSLLDSERLLGFTRTFVLLSVGNNEYNIVNEQYHISNATTLQQQRAFKIVRVPRPNHLILDIPQVNKERKKLAFVLKSITGLNVRWCKKYLEDNNYDFKKTLAMFLDLYKADKVPASYFSN